MNPGLVSRKHLQLVGWSPDRGRAPVALAGLLLVFFVTGVVQARVHDPVPVAPRLRIDAGVSYIVGTKVPAPPSSARLVELAAPKNGRHVFGERSGATGDPTSLFGFYLAAMAGGGWTLAGKADPSPQGEWILKWDFGQQSVLLSFYTAPRARLIVDECPPEPYC